MNDNEIKLMLGDCLDRLRELPDNSVDSIVTDPPYGISFMAKKWDYDVPSVGVWKEAMRVLKPGGHALIACGTRTQHRMVVNIEDAGFEIRDVVSWIYGSGFPKSLNISKAIDKRGGVVAEFEPFKIAVRDAMKLNNVKRKTIIAALGNSMLSHYLTDGDQPAIPNIRDYKIIRDCVGLGDIFDHLFIAEAEREVVGSKKSSLGGTVAAGERDAGFIYEHKDKSFNITAPATESAKQWDGWGTALKPACEFFTLCRKPLSEKTIAANVLKWGTGGINVDGCRVEYQGDADKEHSFRGGSTKAKGIQDWAKPSMEPVRVQNTQGRFPANLIHDGSQEVLDLFPVTKNGGQNATSRTGKQRGGVTWGGKETGAPSNFAGDTGSAARFFYCAKASKKDREEGNTHPTVKPTALMAYLCRLITPTGGTVLDPYMGSGSTGKAARREGFRFVGIEREPEYMAIAEARITNAI